LYGHPIYLVRLVLDSRFYDRFSLVLKDKVKLSLCLINSAWCTGDIWGSQGVASPYFTPEQRPRYRLHRRLSGPQSQSGQHRRKKSLALAGNQTPAAQPVALLSTD
jgi:hypothetical protein